MKLNEKIDQLTKQLVPIEGDQARRMARLIVKYGAGMQESAQIASPDQTLDERQIADIQRIIDRRLTGEPLSRILGVREFYGLSFSLSPATLDPRPETELLIDQAIAWIHTQKSGHPITLLDLGTGTGCIPITILKNCPDVRAVAVDISPDALSVAMRNAREHGVHDRLAFIQSDWFSALSGVSFDLVVSNPPYIPQAEVSSLMKDVRDFDPALALSGGADGLDPYRKIFSILSRYLNPDGLGLFEIGQHQKTEIIKLAENSGLDVCGFWDDYAGIPRVVGVNVHRP